MRRKKLDLLLPECPRCGVRHELGWPHDLRINAGDSSLDTPLCYEINRLPAPDPNADGVTDYAYERVLERWFGDNWGLR